MTLSELSLQDGARGGGTEQPSAEFLHVKGLSVDQNSAAYHHDCLQYGKTVTVMPQIDVKPLLRQGDCPGIGTVGLQVGQRSADASRERRAFDAHLTSAL